jgi:chemotaxis receptor (MCP) glutamine deamidase CheD
MVIKVSSITNLSGLEKISEPVGSGDNDRLRPPFNGNHDKVAEIMQREFGITQAGDVKPILATYGLGPCVGFLGWSSEHQLGFLTHYDRDTDIPFSFAHLLNELLKHKGHSDLDFNVRIIGGHTDYSERLIDSIKSHLNLRRDIRMNLIQEDTGGYGWRSAALDTRTGEVFSYAINKNHPYRMLTEEDILKLTSIHSPATLAYAPGSNLPKPQG